MNQKGSIIPLLLIVLMIGGIVAATQLTTIQQIFQSRASESPKRTSPFYASVQCSADGQAVFRWNDIPEAAEYAVVVARGAAGNNSEGVFIETGKRTFARTQLIPGATYDDWAVKIGFKAGEYEEVDQQSFSCNGSVSGSIPDNLSVYPISASVTCNSNGQANFRWSDYPGALSYQITVYPESGTRINLNAERATSMNANLQAGASYADWELSVRLANDTKVFDQLEFKCDGSTRGEAPSVTASTPTPPQSQPSPTSSPTPVISTQPSAPVCNGHCGAVGETQGGYVCVDDQGDRLWRLPQCTGNSNCECTATTL